MAQARFRRITCFVRRGPEGGLETAMASRHPPNTKIGTYDILVMRSKTLLSDSDSDAPSPRQPRRHCDARRLYSSGIIAASPPKLFQRFLLECVTIHAVGILELPSLLLNESAVSSSRYSKTTANHVVLEGLSRAGSLQAGHQWYELLRVPICMHYQR